MHTPKKSIVLEGERERYLRVQFEAQNCTCKLTASKVAQNALTRTVYNGVDTYKPLPTPP